MKKKLIRKINDGFSLMETLIWVGIVGVFASLIGVASIRFIDNAKVHAATVEMNGFKAALLLYKQTNGDYPEELITLLNENYLDRAAPQNKDNQFLDPWRSPYVYEISDEGQAFEIKSLGSDKRDGGEGNKADIIVSSGMDSDDGSGESGGTTNSNGAAASD